MPETQAQRSEAGRKAAATRQRHEAEAEEHEQALRRQQRIDRTEELSDDVLKSIEAGQRAAIEAVRKFVDTVDEMLPALGRPSRREQVLDAAMDMADRLVHAQYDFLRQVVQSAGKALSRPRDGT